MGNSHSLANMFLRKFPSLSISFHLYKSPSCKTFYFKFIKYFNIIFLLCTAFQLSRLISKHNIFFLFVPTCKLEEMDKLRKNCYRYTSLERNNILKRCRTHNQHWSIYNNNYMLNVWCLYNKFQKNLDSKLWYFC